MITIKDLTNKELSLPLEMVENGFSLVVSEAKLELVDSNNFRVFSVDVFDGCNYRVYQELPFNVCDPDDEDYEMIMGECSDSIQDCVYINGFAIFFK